LVDSAQSVTALPQLLKLPFIGALLQPMTVQAGLHPMANSPIAVP
jgi:hypothetical protein